MKSIVVIPIAILLGVAIFVALLMIVKGGYFATKRRKTKLGLVKLAGAGLKLPDDAPEDYDESSGVDTDGGEAVGPVTVVTGGKTSDEPDISIGDAESQETVAVPIESTKEDSSLDPSGPPPSKQSTDGDKRDKDESGPSDGTVVRQSDSRPFGEKLPMIEDVPVGSPVKSAATTVRKIVDLPIENPFLAGRASSASGDGNAKKTSSPQRKRLPETVKMKDRKVILAEDVAINRDLIAMYFDGSGIKFEFAVNGREVCEKFERDPGAYSMILMDIQMPEMDGYEVSRRIRAMDVDWAKQIPIIAMTGNDQKEDIDLCFDAGMDDHIPKPIDMEVLQEKVFDIITLSAENY